MEETIGKWLRNVIRRLEKEQESNRSNPQKQLNRSSETRLGYKEEIANFILVKEEISIEKKQPSRRAN
jgi:hypothetical protein